MDQIYSIYLLTAQNYSYPWNNRDLDPISFVHPSNITPFHRPLWRTDYSPVPPRLFLLQFEPILADLKRIWNESHHLLIYLFIYSKSDQPQGALEPVR